MLPPAIAKNDSLARRIIIFFSIVVFAAVVLLGQVELKADLPFDVHVFAQINAVLNSLVSVFLLGALLAIKNRRPSLHKRLMMTAMILSVLFLLSYIAHHLLTGNTEFGGEGWIRSVYYFILITHVFLAAIILPFILFTSYRALIAEWPQHKKLARITWPVWFYVAVTGVVVYFMISPYYH
jgi:putative membrane protein